MRNLIFANMTRLKKSRIFCAGLIMSMAYIAFYLYMNYREIQADPENVINDLNWYFFSALPVASAFCAVFCGMFIGTEYSDGTMRNKLMAGHTRRNIYCANLITVFLANVFVFLAGCLVVILMGIPMFGWSMAYPARFLYHMFCGILMLGAYAGIFTLPSMLIGSKAASAVVCMVFYAVMFLGRAFLRTAVFSYYHKGSMNHMPGEAVRPFLEFLYDFLPFGQELQIMGGVFLHPCRIPVYSILCIGLTAICGSAVFAKKNCR